MVMVTNKITNGLKGEGAIDACVSVKKQKKRQNQFCWGLVLIVSMQAEYFTSINIDGKNTYTYCPCISFTS